MTHQTKTPDSRVNDISLGGFERRALPWMAKRLPVWMVPDHLTIVADFAAVLIGVAYCLTTYSLYWILLANVGLIIHWWGDSLDGTLARVRHIERSRYGFFIDHFSDTLSVFIICIGMGLSPLMDLRIALLLIIGYYAMMILVNLVSMCRGVFKISFGKMGPTEVRIIIIIMNTIILLLGNPLIAIYGYELTLFSIFGMAGVVALGLSFLIAGEIERRKLATLDPPKRLSD